MSEESVARYLRYLKDWNWGVRAENVGKCTYRIIKENMGNDKENN